MLENFTKNRNKLYWLTQLGGWSLFCLFNILAVFSFEGFNYKRIVSIIYLSFLGVLFTHIYRFLIKKWKWVDIPLKKIIGRVLIASVIIGLAIFIPASILSYLIKTNFSERLSPGLIITAWFNLSTIIVVWSLIYFLVHYFENYRKVEIERLIWEAAVKDFELKTLKSQLNPHFMFNALNSIRSLIEENPEHAKNAINLLSNIFRYSLKIERIESVPLSEEMQTVADYLSLEQIRFEERLKFKIDIDDQAKFIEIPPMMIQTLVENGIKHGISKIPEGGTIDISGRIVDSYLNIKIINSGYFDNELMNKSNGYGISNTRQRLNIIYGEQATFSIMNKENFVEVIINIPIRGKNESNNN